jgi:hypothetical protein
MAARTITAAAAAVLLWTASGRCDPPPLWSPPPLDPLRAASLPLRPAELILHEPGRFSFEAAIGYFNVQESTWHAPTIHRDLGLVGQPLTAGELAALERRFPDDEIYLLDLEGWQVDLHASLGLGRGWMVSLHLPWLELGQPHWDDLSSSLHDLVDAEQDGFEVFPHGETVAYAYGDAGRTEHLGDLTGSGWGDLSLAVSGPAGRFIGAEHRWAMVVEAPTGDEASVAGSGGWDVGLRWIGTWEGRRSRLFAGVGFARLDPGGGWLQLERQNTWQLHVAYHHRLGAAWSLRLAARAESSPLDGFDDSGLGDTALLVDLGARRELGGGSWLGVSFGENLPQVGVTPDYTLQLLVGAALGRPAAPAGPGVP